MKKLLRMSLISCLLLGATATSEMFVQNANATVVLKLDFDEVVEKSAAVVKGSIAAKEGKFVADGNGGEKPVTFYTFKVEHTYIGGVSGSTIILVNPGGAEKDGMKYPLPSGFTDHQVGEELVVMVEPAGDNYVITGLHQGKYHVLKSSETGKEYVARQQSSAQLIDAETKAPTSAMTAQQLFTMEEFESKLEKAAKSSDKEFKAADQEENDS